MAPRGRALSTIARRVPAGSQYAACTSGGKNTLRCPVATSTKYAAGPPNGVFALPPPAEPRNQPDSAVTSVTIPDEGATTEKDEAGALACTAAGATATKPATAKAVVAAKT